MNETYVECLIKQKQPARYRFLKGLLIVLAVIFGILMLAIPFVFLLTLAAAFGAYFVGLYTDLEYEYLYLDKELVIDKVMGKSKRKRVATYSLSRIEILAPIKSYHLDAYKHRDAKAKDYSIGEELKPDRRYVMFYEGGEKILLSPSEELVKAMKTLAPRKIFND